MLIEKFYVIKAGHIFFENDPEQTIEWWDDLLVGSGNFNHLFFEWMPSFLPIFTTFEEAEHATMTNWNNLIHAFDEEYAKILEYSSYHGSNYQLTHEWFYSIEGAVNQKIDNKFMYAKIAEKEYEYTRNPNQPPSWKYGMKIIQKDPKGIIK